MRGLISILLFLCMSAVSLAEVKIIRVTRSSPVKKIAVSKSVSQPVVAATAATPADASVQIVIDHGTNRKSETEYSLFSGTAISPTKIITCWHGFRDPGRATIDGKPVKLLLYDRRNDVALIECDHGKPFTPVANKQSSQGSAVTATGYELGQRKLGIFRSRITRLNRYNDFSNVSVSGTPKFGRSGGGLFNEQGELIGVCSCADNDGTGIYCGLDAIQNLVGEAMYQHHSDLNNLDFCQQSTTKPGPATSADGPALSDCPDGRCPLLPRKSQQPTPAPQVQEPAPARPVLRSVMKPVQRLAQAQPVRRVAGRLFSGRLFSRLRCR